MIFIGWLSNRLDNLSRKFNEYKERVSIINSNDNLSKYKNKERHYLKTINKYRVFKKSNFKVNTYYWRIKTKDSSYYYTTTDDEHNTLQNILRSTKISEFRDKCVNDFFEYCLVSYVTNEDEELMEKLSQGKSVILQGGAIVRTEEYFEKTKRAETTELDGQVSSQKTPDLYIECGDEACIIDAYNGTSEKEILRKLNAYSESFPNARVYVFSSGVSRFEQLTAKDQPTFAFYCQPREGNKPIQVDSIQCGTISFDISIIREKYFSEYRIFQSEVFYWINCQQAGDIIRSSHDYDDSFNL